MMITASYIWSQILTAIEYILLGASYFGKKRRLIVILDIASMTCGIVAYLLLGADLGMMMSIVILLANFYYLWEENVLAKKPKKKRGATRIGWQKWLVLGIVMGVIVVLAWLTYDGPASLLSVVATVLYEISIWQNSTKIYKFLGIPVALCWMLYNGFILSVVGVVFEGIMLISSIWGYVIEIKGKKKAKRLARH